MAKKPSPARERTPLEAVEIAQLERQAAEQRERAAILAAREAGIAWSAIGELYGLTKQGAQQRFKPALDAARAAASGVEDPR